MICNSMPEFNLEFRSLMIQMLTFIRCAVIARPERRQSHLDQGRKWLSKTGGQVVMQVVMWRGATAGGTFYSAKKGWGAISKFPHCPPFTYSPVDVVEWNAVAAVVASLQ